jgi:hypothetical protein
MMYNVLVDIEWDESTHEWTDQWPWLGITLSLLAFWKLGNISVSQSG